MGSAALVAASFGGLRAQAQMREGTHQAEGPFSGTPEQGSKPLLAENPKSKTPPTRDQGDPLAGFVSAC
jgi:hypothetical protein